jgi:hypothetical protein
MDHTDHLGDASVLVSIHAVLRSEGPKYHSLGYFETAKKAASARNRATNHLQKVLIAASLRLQNQVRRSRGLFWKSCYHDGMLLCSPSSISDVDMQILS